MIDKPQLFAIVVIVAGYMAALGTIILIHHRHQVQQRRLYLFLAIGLAHALAKSMAKSLTFAPTDVSDPMASTRSTFMQGWEGGICEAANNVADYLAFIDRNFDRDAFLRACGVT